MAAIDIRDQTDITIDRIVFDDLDRPTTWSFAVALVHYCNDDADTFRIVDDSGDFVRILSKEHAKNLIKALEKAIELGWVE